MAKHTYTSFYYDDENQKLANALFQFKQSKIHLVERMDIEGLTTSDNLAEFVVQVEVDTRFRKNKTDTWQSLKDFWTADRMFAKSCPHWERRSVRLTVGVGLRGDTGPDPIFQKMVTLSTWFDNKYKSQADGISHCIVSDGYDSTAQQVQADWNDNCISNDMVEENAIRNGIGIMLALSKHLEAEQASNNRKILDMFRKVKV